MVGRLVQLVQDANLSSSLRCSSKHSIAELILRNHLRATEGKKDAALLNTLQALYDFWEDPKYAQEQMKKVKGIQKWLDGYKTCKP